MPDRAKKTAYCAYLLRCWGESGKGTTGSAALRFSLEDPHTGERHPFANPEALMAFLRKQMGCDEARAEGGATPGELELGTGVLP